ncbi:hypothetical protein [Photobacterium kasasachensis]|uniref:hypothetical protein n=1 Tax=Photobacterium kasasachensis TaxID=2910240 RepID=UPI003D1406A2
MCAEIFTANTQYDDHLGTAAADDADNDSLIEWLREEGHAEDYEHLTGVEMYVSDSALGDDNPVWVGVLLEDENDDSIRKIRVNMSFEGFFSSFKRFNVKISRSGDLTGEEVLVDSTTELD